jgi:hypothetical protein
MTALRRQREMKMSEAELKEITDTMQQQGQIEKTLENFDRYKRIQNEIVDVQGRIMER